jgi:predicted transcriptional regulator of viral defense system
MEFINTLQPLDRGFFTVADLEKITGLERSSLKVTLNRLVKQKLLIRLKRGVYQLSFSRVDVAKIANQLYYPSYLSFESALSTYGMLSQIPYTQTFATCKRSKKMTIAATEVEFTQIKEDLFFGYVSENGIYIAEAEKALLDEIYMIARGKRSLNLSELDLKNVSGTKFNKYAQKFPSYIEKLVGQVRNYIGTTPITNEEQERILWKEKSDGKKYGERGGMSAKNEFVCEDKSTLAS